MPPALPTGTTASMTPTEEATARTLIQALLGRYASTTREDADWSQITEIFEPGGTITFHGDRVLAVENLQEIVQDAPPPLLRHHITSVDIQFISVKEAHIQAFNIATTHLKMIDHAGLWNFVARKQADGRWLLVKNVVELEAFDPEGWVAQNFDKH
ncbi:hypothetical protein F5Y16DRAFT_4204 [Xylariaceae sp. FL0255]|nr:hypothetical protein F5Y16DRAFT_4204 [Xylariaceae sp. FL0255]